MLQPVRCTASAEMHMYHACHLGHNDLSTNTTCLGSAQGSVLHAKQTKPLTHLLVIYDIQM